MSEGTDREKEAAEALIKEMKEDMTGIEDVIMFFESEHGAAVLGAEQAKAMAAQAKEARTKGETVCICPACQACKVILAQPERFLA